MKRRTITIKQNKQTNWSGIVLMLLVALVAIVAILAFKQPQRVTVNIKIDTIEKVEMVQPDTSVVSPAVEPTNPSAAATAITQTFAAVGSPLADKMTWFVQETEKRGLNPYLVAAVMAQESGWGKYCPRGNCFGWGFLDGGTDMGIGDGSFETTTTYILDQLATYYAVQTAQEMAARGYNYHPEWVVAVNSIQEGF